MTFSHFLQVFQSEVLSFVLILTFHFTFVNVSSKSFFFELTLPLLWELGIYEPWLPYIDG